MPNHVINELIFRGVTAGTQARILGACCNTAGGVDFEVLVPLPLNTWWGSVSREHERAFGRTALDWCRENWGTKWNAYDCHDPERTSDSLTLRFDTAWAPPYPWLAAVFNHLKLGFEHNWFSEGEDRGHHGVFDWSAMDLLGKQPWIEEPASDELQRHLHKLRWGVEASEDGEEAEEAQ